MASKSKPALPPEVFFAGIVDAALINALSAKELAAFVRATPGFARKVEAGKLARIKIGALTYQFDPQLDEPIADLTFTIGSQVFDPSDRKAFTATALATAALENLALTPNADQIRLTAGGNTLFAPVGTLQSEDTVTDPSPSDADTLTIEYHSDFIFGAAPRISNIETIRLDVVSGGGEFGSGLDASGITHPSGYVMEIDTSVGERSIGPIGGLVRGVSLGFGSGTWTVGAITPAFGTVAGQKQTLLLRLNDTQLISGGFGGQGGDGDFDLLRVVSGGTTANSLVLAAGPDLNEAGALIQLEGRRDLRLVGDASGLDGLKVMRQDFVGKLAVTVASGLPGLGLDLSGVLPDSVELRADLAGASVTLPPSLSIDLFANQLAPLALQVTPALNTTADTVTLRIFGDIEGTGGVITLPGIDVSGLALGALPASGLATSNSARGFERLEIVLSAPPLALGRAHRLGTLQGALNTGTLVYISGPDSAVIDAVDAQVAGIDAGLMTGGLRIEQIDLQASTGRTFTAGSGRSDSVGAIVSLGEGLDVRLETGVVANRSNPAEQVTLRGFEQVQLGFGDDQILGTGIGDLIAAGDGNNTVSAGGGNDTVSAGFGDDLLMAGDGDDSLSGGDGADLIYGEAGNDTLMGGAGMDTLEGGAGTDLLDLGADSEPDTVVVALASDSYVLTRPTLGGVALVGMDVVINAQSSDEFDLRSIATTLDGDVASEFAQLLNGEATVALIVGRYSAVARTFAEDLAGNDTLLVYDLDGRGPELDMGCILLMGTNSLVGFAVEGVVTLS